MSFVKVYGYSVIDYLLKFEFISVLKPKKKQICYFLSHLYWNNF